eukprot:6190623-Pleurochrysis_carterae.AAC.1
MAGKAGITNVEIDCNNDEMVESVDQNVLATMKTQLGRQLTVFMCTGTGMAVKQAYGKDDDKAAADVFVGQAGASAVPFCREQEER